VSKAVIAEVLDFVPGKTEVLVRVKPPVVGVDVDKCLLDVCGASGLFDHVVIRAVLRHHKGQIDELVEVKSVGPVQVHLHTVGPS